MSRYPTFQTVTPPDIPERLHARRARRRQGTIYDALRDFGVTNTAEGDCFIAQPLDSTKFRLLARLRVRDWSAPGMKL
jgi:hypothetical protein